MKKILSFFIAAICAGAFVPAAMTSCTDVEGDGIDSVLWEGSTNPENTSYRNPVWEPSSEGATIMKGAGGYVAISATSQWAPGLNFYCPILNSSNFMQWTKNTNDAFLAEGLPAAGANRVNSIGGDWAKMFTADKYWLFYSLEGVEGIGVAHSNNSTGPYVDLGMMELKTTTQSVKDPFFFVVTKTYYLVYSTEEGAYLQALTLGAKTTTNEDGTKTTVYTCTCSGNPTLIAGPEFKNVSVLYYSKDDVYIFGEVGDEIRYARADNVKGPFLDKSGVSLTDGSKGEPLVSASETYAKPENPMRAFLNEAEDHLYLAYNATEIGFEKMQSGYARKPVFIQPVGVDAEGWLTGTVKPVKGWTSPRFE